jgi:hypothetical protein
MRWRCSGASCERAPAEQGNQRGYHLIAAVDAYQRTADETVHCARSIFAACAAVVPLAAQRTSPRYTIAFEAFPRPTLAVTPLRTRTLRRRSLTLAYRAGDAALIFEVPADTSGPPHRIANMTGVPGDWSHEHRLLFFWPEQRTVALATYQESKV